MAKNLPYLDATALNVLAGALGGVNVDASGGTVTYVAGESGVDSALVKYFPAFDAWSAVYSDGSTKITTGAALSGRRQDLVTNGGFDGDTDWTLGDGWSISGGNASSDGSQSADSDLEQDFLIEVGKSYEVIFTVSGVGSGNVTPVVGGTEGTDRSSNATFTETIVAGAGASPRFKLRADLDFDGDVDVVSVREVASPTLIDGIAGEAIGAMEITGKIPLGGPHKIFVATAGIGRLYGG